MLKSALLAVFAALCLGTGDPTRTRPTICPA